MADHAIGKNGVGIRVRRVFKIVSQVGDFLCEKRKFAIIPPELVQKKQLFFLVEIDASNTS
jgi:hypothetical protein